MRSKIQELQEIYLQDGQGSVSAFVDRRIAQYYTIRSTRRATESPNMEGKILNRASWLFAASLVTRNYDSRVYYLRRALNGFSESMAKELATRAVAKERRGEATLVYETIESALKGDFGANEAVRNLPEAYEAGRFAFLDTVTELELDYGEDHATQVQGVAPEDDKTTSQLESRPEWFFDPITKKRRKIVHGGTTESHGATVARLYSAFDEAGSLAQQSRLEVMRILECIQESSQAWSQRLEM